MTDFADGELTFHELVSQPYTDCTFSAGTVDGHPVDTIYLMLKRSDDDFVRLLLRPDEAAALAWCLTGTLYGVLVPTVETTMLDLNEKQPRNLGTAKMLMHIAIANTTGASVDNFRDDPMQQRVYCELVIPWQDSITGTFFWLDYEDIEHARGNNHFYRQLVERIEKVITADVEANRLPDDELPQTLVKAKPGRKPY